MVLVCRRASILSAAIFLYTATSLFAGFASGSFYQRHGGMWTTHRIRQFPWLLFYVLFYRQELDSKRDIDVHFSAKRIGVCIAAEQLCCLGLFQHACSSLYLHRK